jgi:hypothetical protein
MERGFFMAGLLDQFLSLTPVARVRRNHGLEHATLHLLAQQFPRQSMAGYSNTTGFWIVGDVPAEAVDAAAHEALRRMRSGERGLAVHPNCGTNFVTSGAMAGMAGAAAMFGAGPRARDKFERLSMAALLATIALILSQPLGNLIQARITTSGEPGKLEIVSVTPANRGRMTVHRVLTRG